VTPSWRSKALSGWRTWCWPHKKSARKGRFQTLKKLCLQIRS
jgi:hypothetical protein